MKITSVDIISIQNGRPFLAGTVWKPTIVRINTDEGISGFGEIGLAYCDAINAGIGIGIDFAKRIIGMDPLDHEVIWDMLHRKTFWGMGGGAVVFAGISGIDTALWDIKGKAYNQPVYKLLGGKRNSRIRAYASQLQCNWGSDIHPLHDPKEYIEAAHIAMADGYTAIKLDPFALIPAGEGGAKDFYGMLDREQIKGATERVRAIRENCPDDLDIIIELHAVTDANTAVQIMNELEPFGCMYCEEATQPLNPELFSYISSKVKMPLATGERVFSRWGFRPFINSRSLSVIQPDICLAGGLTEVKKIADMAHVYDIAVQPHVCGSPIATAAALQLEAVIPNFIIHEQHQSQILKENTDLCKYDYQPVNGYFEIPERPGIGNELTEDAIKHSIVHTIK